MHYNHTYYFGFNNTRKSSFFLLKENNIDIYSIPSSILDLTEFKKLFSVFVIDDNENYYSFSFDDFSRLVGFIQQKEIAEHKNNNNFVNISQLELSTYITYNVKQNISESINITDMTINIGNSKNAIVTFKNEIENVFNRLRNTIKETEIVINSTFNKHFYTNSVTSWSELKNITPPVSVAYSNHDHHHHNTPIRELYEKDIMCQDNHCHSQPNSFISHEYSRNYHNKHHHHVHLSDINRHPNSFSHSHDFHQHVMAHNQEISFQYKREMMKIYEVVFKQVYPFLEYMREYEKRTKNIFFQNTYMNKDHRRQEEDPLLFRNLILIYKKENFYTFLKPLSENFDDTTLNRILNDVIDRFDTAFTQSTVDNNTFLVHTDTNAIFLFLKDIPIFTIRAMQYDTINNCDFIFTPNYASIP